MGFSKQNNGAEVILKQVRNYEPLLGNFLLGYSQPTENYKKASAAFVEDNFVIMGLIATFRHLIAGTSALFRTTLAMQLYLHQCHSQKCLISFHPTNMVYQLLLSVFGEVNGSQRKGCIIKSC